MVGILIRDQGIRREWKKRKKNADSVNTTGMDKE
jgi:hypothetical protein